MTTKSITTLHMPDYSVILKILPSSTYQFLPYIQVPWTSADEDFQKSILWETLIQSNKVISTRFKHSEQLKSEVSTSQRPFKILNQLEQPDFSSEYSRKLFLYQKIMKILHRQISIDYFAHSTHKNAHNSAQMCKLKQSTNKMLECYCKLHIHAFLVVKKLILCKELTNPSDWF